MITVPVGAGCTELKNLFKNVHFTLRQILAVLVINKMGPIFIIDLHSYTDHFSYTLHPLRIELQKGEMNRKYRKIKDVSQRGCKTSSSEEEFWLKLTLPWDYTCQKKSAHTLEQECEGNIYINIFNIKKCSLAKKCTFTRKEKISQGNVLIR